MTTKIKIVLLLILFLLSSYLIYNYVGPEDTTDTILERASEEENRFKREYEELNGIPNKDNIAYPNINITSKNYIDYIEVEEVIDILENKTGVIFFGTPKNIVSRNVVPVLVDAAIQTKTTVYYYDPTEIMDEKVKNKEIVTLKEGTDEYYQILDILDSYLLKYEGLDDNSIKRLYMPSVVFVKDGNVLGIHNLSISTHENPYIELTAQEKMDLRSIYITGMLDIK